MCGRSDTKHRAVEAAIARRIGRRPERLERRPAAVLDQDRVGRHAVRDRVGRAPCRLGRPIAVGLAAGHDEQRRDRRS